MNKQLTNPEIKLVSYTEELNNIRAIRETVFLDEQGVSPELEFDGEDETSTHFLAYLQQQPVGTTRIRNLDQVTVKIERVAVIKSARRKGIATQLMQAAIEHAQARNCQKVVVNAQEYVKDLYIKLGFKQVSERFDEAGIPHVKMIKELSDSSI